MSVEEAFSRTKVATIANGENLSDAIPIKEARSGIIVVGSTMSGSSLSFQGCDTVNGTFLDIENGSSVPLAANITHAPIIVPIPSGAMTLNFLKIKSSSNEGAARSLTVIVKS